MGLRFRKSIKVAPGVKINLNKKSTSVTLGKKGAHYTVNSKGKKTASVGIPVTGISYTKTINGANNTSNNMSESRERSGNSSGGGDGRRWYQKSGWIIFLLIFFFPVGIFLMWKYTNWKKYIKIAICAIWVIAIFGFVNAPALEEASLYVDESQVYDIGQPIKLQTSTKPEDYSISESSYKTSGGEVELKKDIATFSAEEPGDYQVWIESGDVKSNTINIKVEDKKAIEEAKAKEAEAARKKAEEEAAKAAQAEQQQEEAQKEKQEEQREEQQASDDPVVYITENGEKYHRDTCRMLKDSKIEKHLSEVAGSYGPCGICRPPEQ